MRMGSTISLRQFLASLAGPMPAEDVLHALLPVMREVAELHRKGRVATLGPADLHIGDDGVLRLANPEGVAPRYAEARLRAIQPHSGSVLRVLNEYRVTTDVTAGVTVEDFSVADSGLGVDEASVKPAYLPDLGCWEHHIGHHDELTDIFAFGLILASLATGLDLTDPDDIARFSALRTNLFLVHGSLHPVIAALIVEASALNRHERATDLVGLAQRLEDYRDQPVGLDVDRVIAGSSGSRSRRVAVLSHLRDRLFDLTRRNRLIHFRPTQSNVNLTVASVPMVIRLESIREEQLCTWGGRFASDVLGGDQLPLNRWLRFEDQPYLPSSLDRIVQETRRDRAEFGFSNLRLIVSFLHWHNLKDAPDERISSPLLWIPVDLVRKKGVSDRYLLRCNDSDAEFNPALRHYLRKLYDIELSETVNLGQTSIEQVHAELEAQIRRSEPKVSLTLKTKPEIRLIHEKAVQRMRHFERRRSANRATGWVRPDFSYERHDYRPLGMALFERYVRPSPLPQRIAVGAPVPPRPETMRGTGGGDAEAMAYSLATGEGHRFSWEIDLTQVTLANLNYRKMTLVRDYNELIDDEDVLPAFDQLFSIEPRPVVDEQPPALDPDEQWNVVPADATQDAAVALARTGRSFIIQGPPGTGKSQTITNLIADYVARGKRVLFVCEKRAALDVVFNRLHKVGLDRLACLIHDSQEDKRGFVLDLKACYESWLESSHSSDDHARKRAHTKSALGRHLGRIEEFEAAMTRLPEGVGADLRGLVRRVVALPEPGPVSSPTRERLPAPPEWDAHRALARRIQRSVREAFGIDCLADHPFARLSPALVSQPQCIGAVERLVTEGERLFDAIDSHLENPATLIGVETTVAECLALGAAARRAIETNLSSHLDLIDGNSPASADFESLHAAWVAARESLSSATAASAGWRDPLAPDDTLMALEQARRQEGSVFRFVSPKWWRLRRTIRERYDASSHAVEPGITLLLEKLASRHAAESAETGARGTLERRFGTQDADALSKLALEWRATIDPNIRALISHARESADPAAALTREARAAEHVEALHGLSADAIDDVGTMSLGAMAELFRDMLENLDDLIDLLPHLRAADQAGAGFAFALRTLPFDVDGIEAVVVSEAVARVYRETPELRGFDADELGDAARRAARARAILLDDNAACIRAASQLRFLDNVRRSTLSVTQLDTPGREFKKTYSTGRRVLEHEFGKTMRYRSIRDLADGETGAVVIDLKPIWLMSPLSVSDTLPLDPDLFDVVIFDEASQIPTEEAVPALNRAPQVIVVGDEMQLPPTSFFSAARDFADIQESDGEDGEPVAILLDADSLLNQAARRLPATLLAWHYRSRSESLISFSNAAFYDGRLVTIPDRSVIADVTGPDRMDSDAPDVVPESVSQLLGRPISFHPVADGVYERRANLPEARLIALYVRELLSRESGYSIGIVAFSEAQQDAIEGALDALGAEDPAFAECLDREYVREDDGQINGLFVKNLENVQGDERDIILLSICYAPDPAGRMTMNFGPINQRGGEKRLNVIFSRARHHMAVVSTIRADAITNTHNDGARALRMFLAFAEARAHGKEALGQSILETLNPEARRVFAQSAPADPVRDAIAAELARRGHAVRTHVGSASFRCDIAILDDDGGGYALGILLDGRNQAAVYDRYVFQPGILRSFGWRVIDVPSHTWLRDPDLVIRQIEAALRVDTDVDDDDPFAGDPAERVFVETVVGDPAGGETASSPADSGEFREFRFQRGNSNKFWRVSVDGVEMTVVYGRAGTKGNTVVKAFESPERARREADKLILEKVRKGYSEVP